MKAFLNARPCASSLPQTLLMLCCLALLMVFPAMAQQSADENGRTAADRAERGAPAPVDDTGGTVDVWNGCDADDCSTRTRVTEGDAATPLEAARLLDVRSLQISEGAPDFSVFVAENGSIGVGTEAPLGRLHVVDDPAAETPRDIFLLDGNGNLEIGGLLTEASSALLKENFEAVDVQAVLKAVAQLPITTWNYKTDAPSIRHMGPMAQDFYAAFGLGADDAHLAPLDVNGVALAAVQALTQHAQTQADRIATLEAQNAQLLERLEALEARMLPRDE